MRSSVSALCAGSAAAAAAAPAAAAAAEADSVGPSFTGAVHPPAIGVDSAAARGAIPAHLARPSYACRERGRRSASEGTTATCVP